MKLADVKPNMTDEEFIRQTLRKHAVYTSTLEHYKDEQLKQFSNKLERDRVDPKDANIYTSAYGR